MERVFAPREIFFYWADRFHYLRLSAGAQKAAAAGTVLIVAWSLAATIGHVVNTRTLAFKESEIGRHKLASARLERDLAQVHGLRARLETRIADLRGALTEARDDRLALRTGRRSLEDRIGWLERTLADLRDSEQSVIERLSEQASESNGIVEKAIAMTGLDADTLIAGMTATNSSPADPGPADLGPADMGPVDVGPADIGAVYLGSADLGRGGPFVPAGQAGAGFPPSAELAATVSLVERRLDRWAALRAVVGSLPITAPLDEFRISSAYGQRLDPLSGRRARHLGIDFVAPFGAPIHATAPGVVVFAGRDGRYGRLIEIDHGHGIRTRYAHLRKILVREGQTVAHRQTIGLLGSSGRSTGPHLHYEVRYQGRTRNPMRFILAGNSLFQG